MVGVGRWKRRGAGAGRSFYVIQYHVILRHVIQRHVILGHVIQRHVIRCQVKVIRRHLAVDSTRAVVSHQPLTIVAVRGYPLVTR